jgi:hypothetical protein
MGLFVKRYQKPASKNFASLNLHMTTKNTYHFKKKPSSEEGD